MTKSTETLDDLARQLDEYASRLPPVNKWNPPLSGNLDMRIDSTGRWFYLDSPIQRPALVKLFSTILKREGQQYFLVTPVEKWRIEVDDAPFVIVAMEAHEETGNRVVVFTTQTEDRFYLDWEHPLWVIPDPNIPEQPRPYAMVRNNLPGLINRAVYYQLVDEAVERENPETGCVEHVVFSGGHSFSLEPRRH